MSHVATVIKTKQKVISVNVNTLLQFENNESNLFQFLITYRGVQVSELVEALLAMVM